MKRSNLSRRSGYACRLLMLCLAGVVACAAAAGGQQITVRATKSIAPAQDVLLEWDAPGVNAFVVERCLDDKTFAAPECLANLSGTSFPDPGALGLSNDCYYRVHEDAVPQLTVDAGPDAAPWCSSLGSVQLGGAPTADGGSGDYAYSWTPPDLLDDPASPNPLVSPTLETVTFTVRVDDNVTSLWAEDTVSVTSTPDCSAFGGTGACGPDFTAPDQTCTDWNFYENARCKVVMIEFGDPVG